MCNQSSRNYLYRLFIFILCIFYFIGLLFNDTLVLITTLTGSHLLKYSSIFRCFLILSLLNFANAAVKVWTHDIYYMLERDSTSNTRTSFPIGRRWLSYIYQWHSSRRQAPYFTAGWKKKMAVYNSVHSLNERACIHTRMRCQWPLNIIADTKSTRRFI